MLRGAPPLTPISVSLLSALAHVVRRARWAVKLRPLAVVTPTRRGFSTLRRLLPESDTVSTANFTLEPFCLLKNASHLVSCVRYQPDILTNNHVVIPVTPDSDRFP